MKVYKSPRCAPQHALLILEIEGDANEFQFTKEDFITLKKQGLFYKGARYKSCWFNNGFINSTVLNYSYKVSND